MDLKNKLSEEEAIELSRMIVSECKCDKCVNLKVAPFFLCQKCILKAIHPFYFIRKSAQGETDEYIEMLERTDSKAFQHTIKLLLPKEQRGRLYNIRLNKIIKNT